MYDSSLISIDEDRCDCLDANSSCLMLCFCLEGNFLERPPTRLSASEACSRVLARQTVRAGRHQIRTGCLPPSKSRAARRAAVGKRSTRGAGEHLEKQPRPRIKGGCPPRRLGRATDSHLISSGPARSERERTQARIGAAGAESKQRCSSTSRRRSPSPTASSSTA